MKRIGIICEYNPFHNGHLRQLTQIRAAFGEDCTIICLMNGNFVQRGAPAIIDKTIRARAAVLSGADLILELPTEIALSSAEGFASGGVAILSRCCDTLCFGTESMQPEDLYETARGLLSPDFPPLLKQALSEGVSFPAARQEALSQLGISRDLSRPNDILGTEYVKAILNQGSPLKPFPILREGDYHACTINEAAPSATALRRQMLQGLPWEGAVPPGAAELFEGAPLHTLEAGERAILARLRTMTDEEFEALPYGSEGLWRKLMKASRRCAALSQIIDAVKSRRYTRTRIDRMIMCAFLGLKKYDLGNIPPEIHALAFTDRGRAVLRDHPGFRNAGENLSEADIRYGSLYGLFCINAPDPPDLEEKRRIFYLRKES